MNLFNRLQLSGWHRPWHVLKKSRLCFSSSSEFWCSSANTLIMRKPLIHKLLHDKDPSVQVIDIECLILNQNISGWGPEFLEYTKLRILSWPQGSEESVQPGGLSSRLYTLYREDDPLPTSAEDPSHCLVSGGLLDCQAWTFWSRGDIGPIQAASHPQTITGPIARTGAGANSCVNFDNYQITCFWKAQWVYRTIVLWIYKFIDL